MMAATQSEASLVRQLSWAQATIDLCLDMERNHSDSRFADGGDDREIVYTFDESVFELFVGGQDEREETGTDDTVYSDRRRAVGIFNTREWRETPRISEVDEAHRIALNRQSAILTTEWLFSGTLPGMRNGVVHISRGHLEELRSRWERLMNHFRQIARSASREAKERKAVHRLLEDRAALAIGDSQFSGAGQIPSWIAGQPDPLRTDLEDYWKALSADPRPTTKTAADFWRYAFSRQLAAELASMRAIGPLGQLVRINRDVAAKLRLVDHSGQIDAIKDFPASERQTSWKLRIEEEIRRRRSLGMRVDRTATAQANDASTLAIVQALANSAARGGQKRRFVLVTADSFLIDVYRGWHCHYALDYEPFIIRPVRHYAPLLNVARMSDQNDGDGERQEKEDIFPALRAAIDPFLLSLNLSGTPVVRRRPEDLPEAGRNSGSDDDTRAAPRPQPRTQSSGRSPETTDDTERWPREMFALRLRQILQRHRAKVTFEGLSSEETLRREVAEPRLFPGQHFEKLASADDALNAVASRGRRIERSAIGFHYQPLGIRLDALKVAADVLQDFAGQDDTALAQYIQNMVDEFGSTNLTLCFQAMDVERELSMVLEEYPDLGPIRVPMALRITYREGEDEIPIAARASTMIERAMSPRQQATGRGGRKPRPFEQDLQGNNLPRDGGFRLYALNACVAMRLGQWDLAHHYSAEALRRARRSAGTPAGDLVELEYLLALAIRFRLGAGAIRDATGEDESRRYYDEARGLLSRTAGPAGARTDFASVRAASELAALLVFGSIWSLAPRFAPGNDYPALDATPATSADPLFRSELTSAWQLCRELAATLGNTDWRTSSSDQASTEIVEQVEVNAEAVFCLARAVEARGDLEGCSPEAILTDDAMRQWIEGRRSDLTGRGDHPEVTRFYDEWFRRLSGGGGGAPPRHYNLDLRIDMTVARLLTATFEN